MSRVHIRVAVMSFLLSGAAFAKLPPPTPEEAAAATAAKEKAAAAAAAEQEALAKVQDRIAADYKSKKGKDANAGSSGSTGSSEVPSAALHTRPSEKAGAYNEAVTPATAPGASSGTKEGIAPRQQEKGAPSR